MKKVIDRLLLFILCYLLIFNSTAFASSIKDYFSGSGKNNLDMETVTSGVYGLLYTIGVILAVCILVTIAISYMVATPNKRAILKERLIYYFAGVIFLVGGLAFLRIYEKAANDVGDVVRGNSTHQAQSLQTPSLAKSTVAVEDACKLPKGDIRKMPMSQLEGFINELDYAISDVKLNVANGVNYPAGIDAKSLEDCAEKLEFARGIFNTLSENAKKNPEKVREDAY